MYMHIVEWIFAFLFFVDIDTGLDIEVSIHDTLVLVQP